MKTVIVNGHEIKMQSNIGAMLRLERISRDPEVAKSKILQSMSLVLAMIQGADRNSTITADDISEWCETDSDWVTLLNAANEELARFHNLNKPTDNDHSGGEGNQ